MLEVEACQGVHARHRVSGKRAARCYFLVPQAVVAIIETMALDAPRGDHTALWDG